MPQTACNPDPRCDTITTWPEIPSIGCNSDRDCSAGLACHGGTRECRDPCSDFKHSCEPNKRCQVRNHQPLCVCKFGFVVSESGELACAPDTANSCHADMECPSNASCLSGRCQNPCLRRGNICSDDRVCEVLDHKAVCLCVNDCTPSLSICLRDAGCPANMACQNYKCVDPCLDGACPDNAPCYVEDHKPICKFCPIGFVPDAKYGCMKGKHANNQHFYRDFYDRCIYCLALVYR